MQKKTQCRDPSRDLCEEVATPKEDSRDLEARKIRVLEIQAARRDPSRDLRRKVATPLFQGRDPTATSFKKLPIFAVLGPILCLTPQKV